MRMPETSTPIATRTIALTAIAMLAFAANSLLCRLALGHHAIDAATFASVRIISGSAMLSGIMLHRGSIRSVAADWRAGAMLFVYVVFFSFAYLSLSAGTGALVLFGAVQITMFSAALGNGETFSRLSWFGLAFAVAV